MRRALTFGMLLMTLLSAAIAKPRTCGQLKGAIDGTAPDLSFDPGAELLAVVATHRDLCVPNHTTLAVLQAVFVHWGDGNPRLMNTPSWDCAAQAFREAFPCNSAPR
ncbi:Rap1a/Tai family immunity protein [Bradyrhizobium sp. CCBAU 51627]|uniref:Rap1a/Tai family immunity protein n=1 Tax=Bradyrhizobium sp. CCBAU 51627 TaxID=1325088 RepID=UPI003FA4BB4E